MTPIDFTAYLESKFKQQHRRKGTMKFSVNSWKMLQTVMESNIIRTTYIYGPPGTGKTWAAYYYGRVEKGFYAITLTDETSAAELRGHFIFRGGDAVWHDGPFIRAMREGVRLVINEITNASADVLALLHPILEDVSTARLTLPSGETITPSDGFHVVATDNRVPELLPEPLQDRFESYIEVKDTNPEVYKVLSPQLRKIAKQKIGDDDRRITARGWIALDKLRKEFGMGDACRLVFGMERGRLVHDALVIAMDESKATEDSKTKKKATAKKAEVMVQPPQWTPSCTCSDCQSYNTYLQGMNLDPIKVHSGEQTL